MTFEKFKRDNNLSFVAAVPNVKSGWAEIYHDPYDGRIVRVHFEFLLVGNLFRWKEMRDEEL